MRGNPDMLVVPGGPLPGIGPNATDGSVRTKSDDSTANIDARVIRAIGASEKMASVAAGKTSCLRLAASGAA